MNNNNQKNASQGELITPEYGFEGEWIHKPWLAFTYGEEKSNSDGSDEREKMKKAPEGNNIVTFNLAEVATGLKITESRLRRANRDGKLSIATTNLPPQPGEGARMKFVFGYGIWQYEAIKIRYGRN